MTLTPNAEERLRPRLRLVATDDPEFDVPSGVGAELKAARLRAGLSIEDVANATKVRTSYLEALEEGREAHLPAMTYVLGFIRSYANMFDLDAQVLASSYRTELARPEDTPPPKAVQNLTEIKRSIDWPKGTSIAFILLAVAVIFAGWRGLNPPAEVMETNPIDEWAPADPDVLDPVPIQLTAPKPAPDQPVIAPGEGDPFVDAIVGGLPAVNAVDTPSPISFTTIPIAEKPIVVASRQKPRPEPRQEPRAVQPEPAPQVADKPVTTFIENARDMERVPTDNVVAMTPVEGPGDAEVAN